MLENTNLPEFSESNNFEHEPAKDLINLICQLSLIYEELINNYPEFKAIDKKVRLNNLETKQDKEIKGYLSGYLCQCAVIACTGNTERAETLLHPVHIKKMLLFTSAFGVNDYRTLYNSFGSLISKDGIFDLRRFLELKYTYNTLQSIT